MQIEKEHPSSIENLEEISGRAKKKLKLDEFDFQNQKQLL